MPQVPREDARHPGLRLNLHTHLEGWVRPDTAAELADEIGIAEPTGGWAAAMRVATEGDLPAFLECVAVVYPLLKSASALERVAAEAVIDAAADGTRFVELRVGPVTHTTDRLPLEAAMEALCAGLGRGIRETGISAGLVPAVLRHHPTAENERLAELAVRHNDDGVVGFDIAGDELNYPDLERHAGAFRIARAGGLGITAHAAEAASAAAARQAFEVLGATRIGHATRLADDSELLAWAAGTGLCLEVCPTSNFLTGAVVAGKQHPARAFLDAGCSVVLGDDNPRQVDSTLSGEVNVLVDRLGLSASDLVRIGDAAIDHAFCDQTVRKQLRAEAETR